MPRLKNDLICIRSGVETHVEMQCNDETLSEKVQFVDLDIINVKKIAFGNKEDTTDQKIGV